MRLTLRTLLAYLDDTLPPDQARAIGKKVAESDTARELVEKIRRVTRRRGLSTPPAGTDGSPSDPNAVAEYLSDVLPADQVAELERICLESDVHLAEVAGCHQILTLLLSEPARVPPTARQRMYRLVKGRESQPDRKPGKTVPVGGLPPEDDGRDSDDPDAAYLLGLASYAKAGSPGRRAGLVGAAAALALGFGLAAWQAWPSQQPAIVGGSRVAVADPTPPVDLKPGPQPPPKPDSPRPEEKTGDGTLTPGVSPEPNRTPAKTDPLPTQTEPKTAPPPPTPDAAPAEPRSERQSVGRVENAATAVVVSRQPGQDKWLRAVAADPTLFSTDKVVALPGYKARVRTETGAEVTLWGNLPEQLPAPVLESAVTFHAPPDGFAADVAVIAGRVYLANRKPGGAKVRLRVEDEAWDVQFPDDKAEVAVEVTRALPRGISADPNPGERPRTAVGLYVVRGPVGLTAKGKSFPQVGTAEVVYWDGSARTLDGPKKADPTGGRGSDYFNPFQVPEDGAVAEAAQKALADLARRFEARDGATVAFAEPLREGGMYDLQRAMAAKAAVCAQAATGDMPAVVDALNDDLRPYVREAAAFALAASVPSDPAGPARFRDLLVEKARLTDAQAGTALQLIRGVSADERTKPEVLDRLVQLLDGPVLVLRELAFGNLLTDVDPDARENRTLLGFDAAAPLEQRQAAVRAWRQRVAELKRKAENS